MLELKEIVCLKIFFGILSHELKALLFDMLTELINMIILTSQILKVIAMFAELSLIFLISQV